MPANNEAELAVSRESRFGGLLTDMTGLSAGVPGASYSRDQEIESDSLGVRCLTRAGYGRCAMARSWDGIRISLARCRRPIMIPRFWISGSRGIRTPEHILAARPARRSPIPSSVVIDGMAPGWGLYPGPPVNFAAPGVALRLRGAGRLRHDQDRRHRFARRPDDVRRLPLRTVLGPQRSRIAGGSGGRHGGQGDPFPVTGLARSSIAWSRTLQPASRSAGVAFSISLWLMPPSQGTKIIAVGVTRLT